MSADFFRGIEALSQVNSQQKNGKYLPDWPKRMHELFSASVVKVNHLILKANAHKKVNHFTKLKHINFLVKQGSFFVYFAKNI